MTKVKQCLNPVINLFNSPIIQVRRSKRGLDVAGLTFHRIRLLVFLIQWHLYPFTFKEPPLLVIRAALIIILAFKQNWPEFY